MTVESLPGEPRRVETPSYQFKAGQLVHLFELPMMKEAAAITFVNLTVVAKEGESYRPIDTYVIRTGDPRPLPQAREDRKVPQGAAYIAIEGGSLRVEHASPARFRAEVQRLRQTGEDIFILGNGHI